ncbi:MAG TPA: cob(I)yrinic acid a,c-diamide adenosyltransferase [Vicinamibacterales bacterium]|nr:cob(I)yrinic acid a,c-diamide adenosyltransferase [Vicinamibacterales bacterium]
MTRIYTKTGDTGETGLFDGTRVSKADPRVEAYGAVDELNAWLGFVRSEELPADIDAMLASIQTQLFALGALLADPRNRIADRVNKAKLGEADVHRFENWIDELDLKLPQLRRFVLPGGSRAGASLHFARTVCRRAERHIVSLGKGSIDPIAVTYVNRLSDLLFVMARSVNDRAGVPETEW